MGILKKSDWLPEINSSWLTVLLFTFTLSLCVLPQLNIGNNYPKIEPMVLLLPILTFYIFQAKKLSFFPLLKNYLLLIILFAITIFVSILINHRYTVVRDYYELIKILKFIIILLFSIYVLSKVNYMPFFRIIFLIVFVLNFLHYFDIFNFNSQIESLYGSDEQVLFFGLNTLGQPDTKRLLGTMGNPNYNSTLMLFFIILFFERRKNTPDFILYMVSLLLFVVCQSRTGYMAYLLIFIFMIWFYRLKFVEIVKNILLFFFFMYINITFAHNFYLNSITDADRLASSLSARRRIETWQHLWTMIKMKPVFGYGPYKEYFYERKMYAENEYILILWRYGVIGLTAFLFYIIWPLKKAFQQIHTPEARLFFLFSIAMIITSLTSNPFSSPYLTQLLAVTTGLFIGTQKIEAA